MSEELEILENFEKDNRFLAKQFGFLQEHYPDNYVVIDKEQVIEVDPDFTNLIVKLRAKGIDPGLVLIEFVPRAGSIILY